MNIPENTQENCEKLAKQVVENGKVKDLLEYAEVSLIDDYLHCQELFRNNWIHEFKKN